MAEDPNVKKILKLAAVIVAIRLIDLVLLFVKLKSGTELTIYPLFPVADFLLIFIFWLSAYDTYWRLFYLFMGGTVAMEYFAIIATGESNTEALYLAYCSIITFIFGAYSIYKFRDAHYVRLYYDNHAKSLMLIRGAVIASVILFIASTIMGQ